MVKIKLLSNQQKLLLVILKNQKKNNKLFANNAKVIIGSRLPAKKSENLEYIEYKGKNFLEKFLKDLLARNISSILVEGGQKTLKYIYCK